MITRDINSTDAWNKRLKWKYLKSRTHVSTNDRGRTEIRKIEKGMHKIATGRRRTEKRSFRAKKRRMAEEKDAKEREIVCVILLKIPGRLEERNGNRPVVSVY